MHAEIGFGLGVEQVRHVVNGHHVGPRHEQRHPVEGNVRQVRRKPAQKQGEGDVIDEVGIAALVDRGVEVRRQAGQRADVLRRADQGVAIGPIDGPQGVRQTANVCADAEIPDAPGVDDDVQRHERL